MSAKNFCSNFALEIRRKTALKSLARTCDVRPHIAFDCEIANARHRLSKLISALAKSRFCQQKSREKASPFCNLEKELLGADKPAVVATDAHPASAQGGVTRKTAMSS